jgi:FMN phosphatase YigB (HAD superfamily)
VLSEHAVVFLLDVDNTLFDNDGFGADIGARLEALFGARERDRYWALYSARRARLSYADYLGALQDFRSGLEDNPRLLEMSSFLIDYPFWERLFPHVLDVIAHLGRFALPVILSDGDVVFQPRKVQRSGLWDAVSGRVVIDVHKERSLDSMCQRYPAGHYVMVDDKADLLAKAKIALDGKITTVFVRQGHYAAQAYKATILPRPDIEISTIVELLHFDRERICGGEANFHASVIEEKP